MVEKARAQQCVGAEARPRAQEPVVGSAASRRASIVRPSRRPSLHPSGHFRGLRGWTGATDQDRDEAAKRAGAPS